MIVCKGREASAFTGFELDMKTGRSCVRGLMVLNIALAFAGCGGGGGGHSTAGGGSGSGGGPISPSPTTSVNFSFSFNPLQQYPPQLPHNEGLYWGAGVAIGDVTGDGRPDVVMTTEGTLQTSTADLISQVMLFPQQANGTLGAPVHAPYLTDYTSQGTGLAIGDLDRDGVMEVVVVHQEGLTVAKYRQATGILETTHLQESGGFSSVAVADFDADGLQDAIAQTWSTGAVFYKGDGRGGLTRIRAFNTPLKGYNRILARDMNKDGRPDLVMTNGQGHGNWYLMLNQSGGIFAEPTAYALPRRASDNWPWMAWGADVADVNRDGRPDVIVSLRSNRPAGIAVYLATSDGGYNLGEVLESYDGPEPVVMADLDGNGLSDIVTLHGGWYDLGYYLRGSNAFEPEVRVSVSLTAYPSSHYRPDGLAVGDINSDGCNDVAIADYQHGLLVRTGANCRR